MTSSNGGIMRRIDPRSRERFEWTLFPLALIAYATGALALLALMAQAFTLPAAFGSTGAVLLDLHSTFELPATAGTHHYFGGAFIADGVTVTGTGARADISGINALSRVLLPLGPLLWSATICTTATAIGLTLARLRDHNTPRPASKPLQVAAIALGIGSTAAQIVSAVALTQIGRVAWDGRGGIDGFTATPDTLFDATPIAIAVALLAVVLVIRRSEPTPTPRTPRARPADSAAAAAHADAEATW